MQDVALVLDHISVAHLPAAREVGLTPTVTVGAAALVGPLIGTLLPDPPTHADSMAATDAVATPRHTLRQNDIAYVPI